MIINKIGISSNRVSVDEVVGLPGAYLQRRSSDCEVSYVD